MNDRRFSMYIRERDDFTCQWCGRWFEPNDAALQCAHMFGRERWKISTRTDPDNACALCFLCHDFMDTHPEAKREFFIKRLGEIRFAALEVRSNQIGGVHIG